MLAAGGYPGAYRGGDVISRLEQAAANAGNDSKVFHAGTRSNPEQPAQALTAGGRVLCVTALGDSVSTAQQRAYQQAALIQWDDIYYRTDIGFRAIAREHVVEK